jgi:hypothetical protein
MTDNKPFYSPAAIDRLPKLIAQDQFPSAALGASNSVLDRSLGRATVAVEVKTNRIGN